MAFGIDIYRYQTVTSWPAVKAAGVDWVYVKLTDGNGPAIVKGDGFVRGAEGQGLPTGGYHYAQFGDPIRQANVLLGEVRRLGATGLPPALDLEDPFTPNATARDFSIRFCRHVAAQGFRPCVYMSASFAGALRPDQWGISGLVIWIAAYGANTGARYNPDTDPPKVRRYYSGRYDIHQHTSQGRVAGITGDVDLNESLTTITGTTPAPPQEEDDMQANETAKDTGRGTWGWYWVGTRQLLENKAFGLAAQGAKLDALAALATADRDLTPEQLEQLVQDAMPTAAEVAEAQRPFLAELIREVVPEEQANLIIEKLAEKLGA